MKISLSIQGIVDNQYKNYGDRLVYARQAFGSVVDGFEIGFFAHRLKQITAAFERAETLKSLEGMPANSLHIALRPNVALDDDWLERAMGLANRLASLGLISFIGFHLDARQHFDHIGDLARNDLRLTWEILGSDAIAGNTMSEARSAAGKYRNWGVTLDVAHIMEMTRAGEPGVEEYLSHFHGKIWQVHFSWPANLYKPEWMEPGFNTVHSLVTLDREASQSIAELIPKFEAEVITVEGVLPPGKRGEDLLAQEVTYLKELLGAGAGKSEVSNRLS